MKSRCVMGALAAALTLGMTTPAVAAEFIVNGGFENQVGFTGNPYDYASTPTGWTTNASWNSNAYNAVKGGAYGIAHTGNYSVRFASPVNGVAPTLSQTFSDVVDAIYTVSFYAFNNLYAGVDGSRPQNFLTASAGGQSLTLADNVASSPNCGSCYVLGTFTFKGTGLDTLSIAAQSDYNYWYVDDISVNGPAITAVPPTPGAVPEPASWAMMVGGFGLLGAALRRRPTARLA